MSGRINSFGNFRCLGYTTITIDAVELSISDLPRPAGCNGAFIRLIANSGTTGNQPIAFFTVPLQPTEGTTTAAPNADTGEPVWNSDQIALWPDQLSAKIISADGATHSARIQWVALK